MIFNCPTCNRNFDDEDVEDMDNVQNILDEGLCMMCEKVACEELLTNREE